MPIHPISGTDQHYYLIAFDGDGVEREEAAGLLSLAAGRELAQGGYSDLWVLSHGWKGDMPAAARQYDEWFGAILACGAQREEAERRGVRPLLVGFHWPSLPWGDEELASPSFGAGAGGAAAGGWVDAWAERIADSPRAREALGVILAAAMRDIEPDCLPPEVVLAYRALDREMGMGADGVAGEPDRDREPFDPVLAYEEEQADAEAEFGASIAGGLLAPLRQLSFWRMKGRARRVGEGGGRRMIREMRRAGGPRMRVHLMGHSFGCIVASAMAMGDAAEKDGDVDSLYMVQGAMSHWSFCSSIPYEPEHAGYFHPVVRDGRVRGPIVTTQSRFDTAVGKLYPKGAGVAGQVAFERVIREFPKYGAVGTFGVRGDGLRIEDRAMLPLDQAYGFEPGRIYNLNADAYIRNGRGLSGAHSDIAHPEVAHAFWSAVLATVSG